MTTRTRRLAMLLVLFMLYAVAPVGAASAGGGCHGVAFDDEPTGEVQATGACFSPAVARVGVGDTLSWLGDGVPHTVTGANGVFDAGNLDAGGETTHTFTAPGVYPYACLLHPGMVGAVVVGKAATASTAAIRTPAEDGPPAPAVAAGAALALVAFIYLAPRRRRTAR